MCGRIVFELMLLRQIFSLAVGGRSYVSEICARRFAGVVCGSEKRPGNLSVERFIRELVLFRIDLMLIACAFRVCGLRNGASLSVGRLHVRWRGMEGFALF
jgi:hypothetical protein